MYAARMGKEQSKAFMLAKIECLRNWCELRCWYQLMLRYLYWVLTIDGFGTTLDTVPGYGTESLLKQLFFTTTSPIRSLSITFASVAEEYALNIRKA